MQVVSARVALYVMVLFKIKQNLPLQVLNSDFLEPTAPLYS